MKNRNQNTQKILKGGVIREERYLRPGNYIILETIHISAKGIFVVLPNTTLYFAKGAGIVCKGKIVAKGRKNAPIKFTAFDEKESWNNITFIGEKSSRSVLENCIISSGRGLKTSDSSINEHFTGWEDIELGGLILCVNNSSPTFKKCVIKGSKKAIYGGGVFCSKDSAPKFINCEIRNNIATNGGGIFCENASPFFQDCLILDNSSYWCGGGVYCNNNSNPKFKNTEIKSNKATNGGGIYVQDSSPSFNNCLIDRNISKKSGSIFLIHGSFLYSEI